MNSLNHYAYGSIGEWMYRKLAGINQIEPGFKKILIQPQFIKGISAVEAIYHSVYGEIKSSWSCRNGEIIVNVTIPANSTAVIILPEQEDPVEVGSGEYCYRYPTMTNLEIERFTLDSTLKEVIEEPIAVQIIEEHAPGMLDHPMIQYAYNFSISELLTNTPEETAMLFKLILRTLNEPKEQGAVL
jgi:alpha-L-rhamnosidase